MTLGIVFITIVLFTSIVTLSDPVGSVEAASPDGPTLTSNPVIRINNDTELASLISSNHWNGTGTADRPYVIENLEIVAPNETSAIYIAHTSAYLIIRNCSVNCGIQDQNTEGGALTLDNVPGFGCMTTIAAGGSAYACGHRTTTP